MYGNSKTLWFALATLSLALASPLAPEASFIAPRDTSNSTYPGYAHPENGVCTDYTVKDTITFPQVGWDYPIYKDNYDVAAFLFNLSSSGKGMGVFNPFSQPQNVTKTYELSGTFCKPKTLKDGKEKTVLVATHGFGFDRRYWASSYKPEEYSFVQYMLNAGYSIFYYDRLGVGLSQRVSGFENQAEPEVILLARMMQEMRKGQYTDDVQASKLVIVGHSFGSSLSNSVLSQFPDVADAAVLTGIAYPNKTDIAAITPPYIPSVFGSRIASTLPPSSRPQFADTFDTGYLGFGDIYAYIETFLRQPHYEVAAAQYSFSVAQPLGVAEFLTSASMGRNAPDFKGRIMITSGQYDLILCDGDCYSVYKYGTQNETFSGASERVEYVQPDAGHGQNFHENSRLFFGEVVNFMDSA